MLLAQFQEGVDVTVEMGKQASSHGPITFMFFVVIGAIFAGWLLWFWFVTLPDRKTYRACYEKLCENTAQTHQMTTEIHDHVTTWHSIGEPFISMCVKFQRSMKTVDPELDVSDELAQIKGVLRS